MWQKELDDSMPQRTLGRQVSLPLLKHQIDKKILKITWMVDGLFNDKKLHKKTYKKIKWESRYVQTQNSVLNCQTQGLALKQIKCDANIIRKQERQSLKHFKEQNKKRLLKKKQDQVLRSHKYNNDQLVKQPTKEIMYNDQNTYTDCELIESNGYTFRQIDSYQKDSTDKQKIQNSQDDRIFQSINFGVQIKNAQQCQSENNMSNIDSNKTATINRSSFQNTQCVVSSFSQLKPQKLAKKNRRLKTHERSITLQESSSSKNILVSQQCKLKMRLSLQQVISRKRKEITDNNLRINILKKIEERYNQ